MKISTRGNAVDGMIAAVVFPAVAYLYERIKHQEEIVLENDESRNSLQA
jgi:hypothetical protein